MRVTAVVYLVCTILNCFAAALMVNALIRIDARRDELQETRHNFRAMFGTCEKDVRP